jgi:hypothetical protein
MNAPLRFLDCFLEDASGAWDWSLGRKREALLSISHGVESWSKMFECYGEEECGTGWRSIWHKLVDKGRQYDNWSAIGRN